MSWMTLTRVQQFADHLELPLQTVQTARRQAGYIYIETVSRKSGKPRNLCYPPRDSELFITQRAIKEKCLATLPLCEEVRGYRKGMHNINCATIVSGYPYQAKIDIRAFHPSISPSLVRTTLLQIGLSYPVSRLITQLVTYKNRIPQGASTSNHVANLIVHSVLTRGVLVFCRMRNVVVVNYGDDTAFAGHSKSAVDACKEFAKREFARLKLEANEKSSGAEHRGERRLFIGTSTGRSLPDLPRAKYREHRAKLRVLLETELQSGTKLSTSEKDMRSQKARIAYVARLSAKKARGLKEVFHRLGQLRREKIAGAAAARRAAIAGSP